jgi:hypothetical protein
MLNASQLKPKSGCFGPPPRLTQEIKLNAKTKNENKEMAKPDSSLVGKFLNPKSTKITFNERLIEG